MQPLKPHEKTCKMMSDGYSRLTFVKLSLICSHNTSSEVRGVFSLQSHMNLLAIPTRIIGNVKEPLYCISSLS